MIPPPQYMAFLLCAFVCADDPEMHLACQRLLAGGLLDCGSPLTARR